MGAREDEIWGRKLAKDRAAEEERARHLAKLRADVRAAHPVAFKALEDAGFPLMPAAVRRVTYKGQDRVVWSLGLTINEKWNLYLSSQGELLRCQGYAAELEDYDAPTGSQYDLDDGYYMTLLHQLKLFVSSAKHYVS